MKTRTLDEMPPLTDAEIDGYLALCRRDPNSHIVWGNDTVGRIILALQAKQGNKSDSRWIPRDRAPGRGGDEIYYIVRRIWKRDGSALSPAIAWWDMHDKQWRLMPDEGWPEADEEITHWMPVPESPSEVHKPDSAPDRWRHGYADGLEVAARFMEGRKVSASAFYAVELRKLAASPLLPDGALVTMPDGSRMFALGPCSGENKTNGEILKCCGQPDADGVCCNCPEPQSSAERGSES